MPEGLDTVSFHDRNCKQFREISQKKKVKGLRKRGSKMNSSTYSVKDITKTAMMAAITFIGIYTVKIPSLHGLFPHGGLVWFSWAFWFWVPERARWQGASAQRCPIFWAAHALVIPTFIIKYIMATVMGLFIDKIMPNRKGNWLIGSIVGGIVQIILYTVFKVSCSIGRMPSAVYRGWLRKQLQALFWQQFWWYCSIKQALCRN